MIARSMVFYISSAIVICDAKCEKAWGINNRPFNILSEDEPDDYEMLADDELDEAPENPGTSEGGHFKPVSKSHRLNRWCVRECERSSIINPVEDFELKDFSKRISNLRSVYGRPK